jgi:hypothetical protein
MTRADAASAADRRRGSVDPGDRKAMIPALQFTNWQWLSLTLAAPVAAWGA